MKIHIEPSRFRETLTSKELNHLASCQFCQESMAEYIEQYELLSAPANLKASILEQSKKTEVQIIAGTNRFSKQLRLVLYGLKVGTAVLCSLMLLAAASSYSTQASKQILTGDLLMESSSAPRCNYYKKATYFTEKLNMISYKNLEVIDHDKKEK